MTDRQTHTHTPQSSTTLHGFKSIYIYIYIISLNSQNKPTESSLTEEETEAETGNRAYHHPGKEYGVSPRLPGQTQSCTRCRAAGAEGSKHTPLLWNFPYRGKAAKHSPT